MLHVKQEDVFFPVREAYLIANETLEGAATHAGVQIGGTTYDLPEPVPDDAGGHAEGPIELVIDPEFREEDQPVKIIEKAVAPTHDDTSGSGTKRAAVDGCLSKQDPASSGAQRTATKPQLAQQSRAWSSDDGAVASDVPMSTKGVPLKSLLLPWRRHHKDPVSGHRPDHYRDKIDHRSWRVPYIPIDDWQGKTDKQKTLLYEQFREATLEQSGFDVASERKPFNWLPHTPVAAAVGLATPIDQTVAVGSISSRRWKPTPPSPLAMPVVATTDSPHRDHDEPPLFPAYVTKLVPSKGGRTSRRTREHAM